MRHGRSAVLAAISATLVLAAGAWAGSDAVEQVDGRYRMAPTLRVRAPAPVPTPGTAWDWEAPVAAAPPTGTVWGQEVGRGERAFFDTGIADEPPPVRVHRGHRRRAFGDEDWTEAPVAAEGEPVDEPAVE